MRKLSLKGQAFPLHLNPAGNVFGGWVMAKMDEAAGVAVHDIIKSSSVTVAVSNIHFLKPVHNGDIFSIYTEITAIGNTSITIDVSVEIKKLDENAEFQVTSAQFIFVAMGKDGKPVSVRSVLRDALDEDIRSLL